MSDFDAVAGPSSTPTSSSTSGKKVKAEGVKWSEFATNAIVAAVDSLAGDDSPLLGNQQQAFQNMVEHIKDEFTNPNAPLDTRKVRDKLAHIWRECKQAGCGDIKEFWRHGTAKLDMASFENKFLKEQGYHPEDYEDESADAGTGSGDTDVAASRKRDRAQFEEDLALEAPGAPAQVDPPTPTLRDLFQQERWNPNIGLPERPTDNEVHTVVATLQTSIIRRDGRCTPAEVRVDMRVIYRESALAVNTLLPAMGFPPQQPPALDTTIRFSDEMAELLAMLMGTWNTEDGDWKKTNQLLRCALSLQTADQISLNILIQSLVGAAVVSWVFDLLKFNERDEFTPEELEQRFPDQAKMLSEKLDTLIGQVIPSRRGSAFLEDKSLGLFSRVYPKAAAPITKEQTKFHRPDPSTAHPIADFQWQEDWLESLALIFHLALQFRANLSMHDRYTACLFEFPAHLDPTAEAGPNCVMLGLLPTIKVQELVWDHEDEAGQGVGEPRAELRRLFDGVYHAGFFGADGGD
ncbi:uncharacterized protein AB675_11829 [Cyphellophora attinorum]|uniref:Uncharacterized protein n=1 Tax=Cyphellophora attinorum TaxID=1664694 RepID=A0A0N0NJM6_9EURO|nr:uncharacterized protein AB675_11829 [Phialophora attinorum]KPI36829.1 hypothetical protein AB675_11829 [Phialophora attinorum]